MRRLVDRAARLTLLFSPGDHWKDSPLCLGDLAPGRADC